ncbi:MAG: site-2 protease family protein [Candidatus Nanopelagicales bacterium]
MSSIPPSPDQQPALPRAGGGGGLRLFGIPVELPLSGVFGIALLAFLWAPAFDGPQVHLPTWVVAVAFALLLSLATLIHEFAHALLARRLGFNVHKVVLHLMGGVTLYERRANQPWRELLIAAGGPAATFAVAGVSILVARAVPNGGIAWMLAWALMWANLVMGIYNSLPGLPLDGGAVLRSLVWGLSGSERSGVVVAAWTGRLLAVLTAALPFAMTVLWGAGSNDALVFVIALFLAITLWQGAGAQLAALDIREKAAGLSADALARRAIPVTGDLPLAEAIRRASAVGAAALVVVDQAGQPVAVGSAEAIAAVPLERRPWVTVGAVSRSLDAAAVLPRGLAGEQLLRTVISGGRGEYLVVDDLGRVYGVLQAGDVESRLRA